MADIYSTNDAGKILGINPNTIKTWKNRTFQERLIEGTHWITQQNQIFWTEAGLAELKAISESATDSTMNQQPIQAESAADSIKAMLQPLAQGIAAQALPLLRELQFPTSATQAEPLNATANCQRIKSFRVVTVVSFTFCI